MPTKIYSTLDPNKCGPGLDLSQGNLIVTTTDIEDFNRAVFGNVAVGAGMAAFEAAFYSTSRPAAGLVDLCSVGLVKVGTSLQTYVGGLPGSYGFLPANGDVRCNDVSLVNSATGNVDVYPERKWIGVVVDYSGAHPIAAWHVEGNRVFQTTLDDGFYLPAVSIGSTAAPDDVKCQLNFGPLLNFPFFTVDK